MALARSDRVLCGRSSGRGTWNRSTPQPSSTRYGRRLTRTNEPSLRRKPRLGRRSSQREAWQTPRRSSSRKTKLPKYLNGAPNPEARVLGGVLVRGRIEREVTVNLIALRGLRGESPEETRHIQKYVLGLSLVAATTDIDLFLREGCHLRYTGEDVWYSVPRRGEPNRVDLESDAAQTLIQLYAVAKAAHFRPRWPQTLEYSFDLKEAKKLLAKQDDENANEDPL